MLPGMLWQDARVITSTAVSVVGTIAALRKNVSALTERKTLRSKKQKEEAHLADLLELRRKLDGLEMDPYTTIRRQADSEVAESSHRLSDLMTKESELSRDPNNKLSLAERLFLLFPPVGLLRKLIHYFAHFFMFVLPLLILVRTAWNPLQPDTYADLIVLTSFAVLSLRAWALAERRWAAGLQTKPRAVTTLFILNKPVNREMRIAQIFLWICLFCAVESLEDVLYGLVSAKQQTGEHRLFGPSLLLMIFLLAAAVCRAWGAAELNRQAENQDQNLWAMLFPGQRKAAPRVWLVRIVYFTALVLPMLMLVNGHHFFTNRSSTVHFFADDLDRTELVLVWIACSVAANRWLNALSLESSRGMPKACAINIRATSEKDRSVLGFLRPRNAS